MAAAVNLNENMSL